MTVLIVTPNTTTICSRLLCSHECQNCAMIDSAMKLTAALLLFSASLVLAQTPAPAAPAGEVIGVGNFIHVVGDAERSLAFYRDVIGMASPPAPNNAQPPSGPRPYLTTPEILSLYNVPGSQYRVTNGMIAESPMRAELVEWKADDRKPIRPRFQDPGAADMILMVRDIDAIMARVKKAGSTVISMGGEPVTIPLPNGKMRMVLLQDPDGFFVELIQPDPLPAAAAQASNNIFNISFSMTVEDMDKTLRVFKAMGFEPQVGQWMSDKVRANAAGLPATAQYRRATALVPGSSFEVAFLEFKGVDRKTYTSVPRDPGTPVLRLRVRDIESILGKLSSVGVTVASKDAQFVTLTNPNGAQRFAITNGPDNVKIQLVQAVPKSN
jgi:catechol 2,3-dioxygenase-like lactoylglutathione lyase family enzyme